MKLAIVIPATHGREENLELAIAAIRLQHGYPAPPIVVVDDGGDLKTSALVHDIDLIRIEKHEPGKEQPRNIGARLALAVHKATHVWFIDSDVLINPDAVAEVSAEIRRDPSRILVGPYDWLEEGLRPEGGRLRDEFWERATSGVQRNDPRWAMFEASPPERVYRGDLSAGLACFSGNLVWPIAEFQRVGGFHRDLYHGRCEDGELGLRAVAMDVPISLVKDARGVHLWHPVNVALAIERNRRDVPLLNSWHPWVEGEDVFMVDRDGKAFDRRCPTCGELVPTILWWQHGETCG